MIFLDSTYIIGLIIKKDNYTSKSLKLEPIIECEKKLINNTVFNEVLNSLTATNSDYDADTLSSLLLSYEIVFLNADDYAESISLFKYSQYVTIAGYKVPQNVYKKIYMQVGMLIMLHNR